MPAAVFRSMPRVFARTFAEPGQHFWHRHDGTGPERVTVIWNRNPVTVDADGLRTVSTTPSAHLVVADLLALAPNRAGDLTTLVSNRDRLEVAGEVWRVESCSPDGNGLVQVALHKG